MTLSRSQRDWAHEPPKKNKPGLRDVDLGTATVYFWLTSSTDNPHRLASQIFACLGFRVGFRDHDFRVLRSVPVVSQTRKPKQETVTDHFSDHDGIIETRDLTITLEP